MKAVCVGEIRQMAGPPGSVSHSREVYSKATEHFQQPRPPTCQTCTDRQGTACRV